MAESTSSFPSRLVCAVVVAYFPGEEICENLRAIIRECGRVVVVDNGSTQSDRERMGAIAGVELIVLPENLGVASALNRGAEWAIRSGYTWMVTFDQDSVPAPGFGKELWASHLRHPNAAIVGASIVEGGATARNYRWVCPHPLWPGLFRRVECDGADLSAVTMAITSGSMTDLSVWTELGGFSEDLFIDYVDIDYCLKAIRAQRTIAIAAAARLEHMLGARQTGRILGIDLRPMHHAAFRHYYMARNRVIVWHRHALAVPHWALFDLVFAGFNAFRVFALEPGKWIKIKAMVFGTWDGFQGRSGACPRERLRMFVS